MVGWIDRAALALFTARWFTPTEGAIRGDTLWLAQLWIGWAVVAAWLAWREGRRVAFRFSWLGLGLTALVAGHLISGFAVLATEGQKRAALNGMAEWIGIGITAVWLVTRARVPSIQRSLVISLVASSVALSGLGLWQRLIWRPALARAVLEFDQLEGSLKTLDGEPRREAMKRLQTLRREIGPDYIGLDSNGRMAMRQRLVDSIEPLGFFALANSFAGLLTPGLFLAGSLGFSATQIGRRALFGGFTALIGFVLILTKSRTAWAGTLAGLATAGFARLRAKVQIRPVWIIGTLVAIAALFGLAAATGGLDRLVLSESTKSLRYRMEYWRSTAQLIAERPLLGVGPGNFRQNYLKFKLPESSEEILDPHNLFLDVWANGGLIAFLGLIAVIGATARYAFGSASSSPEPAPSSSPRLASRDVLLPLLAGSALVLFESWFLRDFIDPVLVTTAVAAALLAPILNALCTADLTRTMFAAAWAALTVHLLGAGGIAMPAIAALWIWMAAATIPAVPPIDATQERRSTPIALMSLALATLFISVLQLATLPVMQCSALMAAADTAASVEGNLVSAKRLLEMARLEDKADPEPNRRLAQVEFALAERNHDDKEMQSGLVWLQEAAELDPRNPHDDLAYGDAILRFFNDPKTIDMALKSYSSAVAKYPNHSFAQAGLARALAAAGKPDDAKAAAHRALELDQLNRDLGHYDRLLPDDTIAALRQIGR